MLTINTFIGLYYIIALFLVVANLYLCRFKTKTIVLKQS